jgi:plastocyanin
MKFSLKGTWIAAGLAALLILAVPLPAGFATSSERTFHIQASRFQYSPAVLRVNPGDRVTIELEAADVVHGLSIDGYNLEMTADPGQTARLTFLADRPGVFRFRCSVACGNMHPFMIGKLYVGQNGLLLRATALGILWSGWDSGAMEIDQRPCIEFLQNFAVEAPEAAPKRFDLLQICPLRGFWPVAGLSWPPGL